MGTLINHQCITCFIEFGIPAEMDRWKRKDHSSFYCPAGHAQIFSSQSEEEKLRTERDRLKQQIAQKDDEIVAERNAKCEAEEKAERLRKRVHKGVCPCCTRSFSNLARHMATKHPENNVVPMKRAKA